MKPSEWLKICDQVANLWPSSAWKPATAKEAYPIFEKVSFVATRQAVLELSIGGREFAPPPGVLLGFANAVDANLRPRLAEPDRIRDLTLEERARAKKMAEVLRERVAAMAAGRGL